MRLRWLCSFALLAPLSAAQAQYPPGYYPAGSFVAAPYRAPNPPVAYGYPAPYQAAPAYGYPAYPGYPPAGFMPASMQAPPIVSIPAPPPDAVPGYGNAAQGATTNGASGKAKAVHSDGAVMPGHPGLPEGAPNECTGPNCGSSGSSCLDGDCGLNQPRAEQFFFKIDYNFSFIKPMAVNGPLVTTGPLTDPNPGSLNYDRNPGTSVLFGPERIDFGLLHGFRFELGFFCDEENHYSADFNISRYGPTAYHWSAAANGSGGPLLARPIYEVGLNRESALYVAAPGFISGYVNIDAETDMWGMEVNTRWHDYSCEHRHSQVLVGFRTTNLNENLRIQDRKVALTNNALRFQGSPVPTGGVVFGEDNFNASNQFYGVQIGAERQWEQKWATLGLSAKLAIGATDQETDINGGSTLFVGRNQTVAPGNVLTQITNIDTRNRYVFGFMPELGANLTINCSDFCRFRAGYTFLLWNNVIRGGTLYDRNISPDLPSTSPGFAVAPGGGSRPMHVFRDEIFMIHTVNFGLEFHY